MGERWAGSEISGEPQLKTEEEEAGAWIYNGLVEKAFKLLDRDKISSLNIWFFCADVFLIFISQLDQKLLFNLNMRKLETRAKTANVNNKSPPRVH